MKKFIIKREAGEIIQGIAFLGVAIFGLLLIFSVVDYYHNRPDINPEFVIGQIVIHKVFKQEGIILSYWRSHRDYFTYRVRMVNPMAGKSKISGSAGMAFGFGGGSIKQEEEPTYIIVEFYGYELEVKRV